jgi:hypothetical protein
MSSSLSSVKSIESHCRHRSMNARLFLGSILLCIRISWILFNDMFSSSIRQWQRSIEKKEQNERHEIITTSQLLLFFIIDRHTHTQSFASLVCNISTTTTTTTTTTNKQTINNKSSIMKYRHNEICAPLDKYTRHGLVAPRVLHIVFVVHKRQQTNKQTSSWTLSQSRLFVFTSHWRTLRVKHPQLWK